MLMQSTYDRELAIEVLTQIFNAVQKIKKRFASINSAEEFTNSDEGMEKLDAICMQLIAVGESLKNLDKITSKKVLAKYPEIDWKKVMGMRDVISHE
jgi:uncharacterized protein with HEPN domain